MKPIIEIQNISKRFLIRQQRLPYLTIREKIAGLFTPREKKETFWALDGISFNVMPGESLGIIGRNGAGKSTLLKILSRITPPTSGRIVCRGRLASLLEVGTGFHQELSGRENIFMNGSILGMKRSEIHARFDEMVEFSGVGKFIDTQLKYFSSGMQLRLAFAVAAHLDPDILIVDEVLAVGDAEFQRKCLRKMADATGNGRTVIFVSHNLPSLKAICSRGALLRDGKLIETGNIKAVIESYTSFFDTDTTIIDNIHYYQPHILIKRLSINKSEVNSVIVEGDQLDISMVIEFKKRTAFELDVHLKKDEQVIVSFADFVRKDVTVFEAREYRIDYTIQLPELRSGKYKLDLFFTEPFTSWFAVSENIIDLEVINSRHHTFLNSPTLKWGSVLATGQVKKTIVAE